MAFGKCKVGAAARESTARQLLWWNCGGIFLRSRRPIARFSPA